MIVLDTEVVQTELHLENQPVISRGRESLVKTEGVLGEPAPGLAVHHRDAVAPVVPDDVVVGEAGVAQAMPERWLCANFKNQRNSI